jgi:uncharacterized protein (DUF2252 family)
MPAAMVGVADRREYGKSRRQVVHRVDQCAWRLPARRPDPVDLLLEMAKDRVPELLPIKWTRMGVSPFGFFRGAVPLMAFDLNSLPVSGITVQICGDAHVRNLGAFASPTGALVFDINDFDETIAGPWEWDLKRLATSIVLAGREAGNTDAACRDAVLAFSAAYRKSVDDCSRMTVLQLARYTVHRHLDGKSVQGVLQKAERATPQSILGKLTSGNSHRFKDQPPLLKAVAPSTRAAVLDAMEKYKLTVAPDRRRFLDQYRPEDVAFKVVGTGSVGTRDYLILFFGNGPDDPLFLQMKEEPPSAYAQYLKDAPPPRNQGERVVGGQRLMQAQSDIFLGYTSMDGRDYLVRQYADFKAAINPAELKAAGLQDYARTCGEVLGKGHGRSGDACALAGYCGDSDKLDRAIAQFAFAYADQTDADARLFQKAIKSGRLKTVEGVL